MKKLFKKLYRVIPFKQPVYYFIKIFWTPPQTVFKHLHFNGIMKVKVNEQVFFRMHTYGDEVENEIFWLGLAGGWEKQSMKLWIQLCLDAEVILDVGANTGIYSLVAQSINPKARVLAFEPISRVHAKLVKNKELNHFQIRCMELALSDRVGQQVIFENDNPHVNAATLDRHTAVAYSHGTLNKETLIHTSTIDQVIESEKLTCVDLVKIDVETHEPQVVEGFKKYLPQFKPAFLVEILMDEVGRKLQQVFDPLGYLYFSIDDQKGTVRRVQALGKSDYFNFLICTKETARKLELIKPTD